MRLMRLALFLAVLPWAVPCSAHPKVQCAVTRHDFGEQLPGLLPPVSFSITNAGDAPLILRPQPCCGIIVLGAEKPIPPRATRSILIRAAHLHEGLLRKTVHVLTNDPKTPDLQLQLLAVGKSPIVLFPGDELTVPLNGGAGAIQRVTLHSNDEPLLKITSIRCSAPYLHCGEAAPLLQDSKEPGRDRAVEVSVSEDAPGKPFEAVVVLGTSCKRCPEVKLHVFGISAEAVTVQPPRIDFDPIDPKQLDSDRLVMLSRAGGKFKILAATASDPRMELKTYMDSSGTYGEVLATFTPGQERGPFTGTITIRTDDPERPRLVIPYAGEAK